MYKTDPYCIVSALYHTIVLWCEQLKELEGKWLLVETCRVVAAQLCSWLVGYIVSRGTEDTGCISRGSCPHPQGINSEILTLDFYSAVFTITDPFLLTGWEFTSSVESTETGSVMGQNESDHFICDDSASSLAGMRSEGIWRRSETNK